MRRVIAGCVTLVLVLTACGGDDGPPDDGGTTTPGSTGTTSDAPDNGLPDNVSDDGDFIVITITDLSFPENVMVPTDRGIQWDNESGVDHVIVFETGPVEIPDIELGSTAKLGIPIPAGEWTYFCSIHPQMTGSLSVT